MNWENTQFSSPSEGGKTSHFEEVIIKLKLIFSGLKMISVEPTSINSWL